MWYSQYGRLWNGPWFVIGEVTSIAAGIIELDNLPTGRLMMGAISTHIRHWVAPAFFA